MRFQENSTSSLFKVLLGMTLISLLVAFHSVPFHTWMIRGFSTSRVLKALKMIENPKLQRIERIISNRGWGSRKEVAKLFRNGLVKIDGIKILSGATKVPADAEIEVDGMISYEVPLLALYHKPVGIHSTMGDPMNRASLEELKLDYPYLKSMHPVGRLDADTSGLLLFSSNGQLTQTLLHPSSNIEREYEAIVAGEVNEFGLREVLAAGVETTEGTFAAKLVAVQKLEDVDDSVSKDKSEGVAILDNKRSFVRLTVTEGKYRMVRRILHNAGHSVIHLHRIRYGGVYLSDLEESDVCPCSPLEKEWAVSILSNKLRNSFVSEGGHE